MSQHLRGDNLSKRCSWSYFFLSLQILKSISILLRVENTEVGVKEILLAFTAVKKYTKPYHDLNFTHAITQSKSDSRLCTFIMQHSSNWQGANKNVPFNS